MSQLLARLIRTVGIALIPTLFCALMASPLSYGLPLACPAGSRVIGIECFDAAYNNTTPWYRKDFGASIATFPLWLLGSLGAGWWLTRPPLSRKQFDEIRSLVKQGRRADAIQQLLSMKSLEKYQAEKYVDAVQHPPPGVEVMDYAWNAVQQAAPPVVPIPHLSQAERAWLPSACPHCGGSLSTADVQWISSFEARCPFCGGVLKKVV